MAKEKSYVVVVLLLSLLLCLSSQAGVAEAKHHLVPGPPTHEINHTSYIGASSNIGAFKEGYLCKHEEFDRETTCYRLSTHPEHAANWFHTKRSNDLGFIPFTSQATYTASELVLFKESNSLLKKCATQTHVWKPGDHSLHLRPLVELIPCTKPHWISQILHHSNLPFLEQICNKTQRQVFSILGCELAIYFINQKLPKAPRIFPKLSRCMQLNTFPILAKILSLRPNG
uniref:BURP domain-containing protein n=1 Tax=Brassica oleracea var. oleracea TaxID=109376 RepID=A0A0D3EGS5_BRAOL